MASGEYDGGREGTDRGQNAERPSEIPKRGWFDVLKRVRRSIGEDNVPLISAGVAFFAMLAAFPMLAALVLIYGLVSSPAEIAGHVEVLTGTMPADAARILEVQLEEIAGGERRTLGLGLALTLLVALWSARRGMVGLMSAVTIAYGEAEQRSFVKKTLVALALTLGFILGFLALIALAIVVPIALRVVPLGPIAEPLLLGLRWLLLAAFLVLALALVYRFAPSRHRPKWRWISPGALVATGLWILATWLFAFYVGNFGSYNETYGALGGAIILILWFYVSAFVIVLGAELNSELERQTSAPSTMT
jgi:membrane protein